MTDADKLREAIERVGPTIVPLCIVEDMRLIIAAAKSTLPPPAWKVRAYYRPNSEEFEAFEYPTEIEARQQAHYLITGSVRKVEIEAP